MPFLHLFARGAQVLNAGLPFYLEGRRYPITALAKSSAWAADF